MKIKFCLAAPPSWVGPREIAPQLQAAISEDSVSGTEIYNALELKKHVLERHYHTMQKDIDKAKNIWSETMQFSEKYDWWKPVITEMMHKYGSM